MTARGTALALRSSTVSTVDPPDTVDVVAEGRDVPDWVLRWCRGCGRRVQLQPTPDTAVDRIRAVAGLVGHTVLVPRPALRQPGPPRIVAAVRDLPADAFVLAEGAQVAAELDCSLVLVHGVPLSFGERSVGLDAALEHGRQMLDAATDLLSTRSPRITVEARLLRVRPHELVGEELEADLLVLGGPRARTPVSLGLVASSAVQHAACPVLLAPRVS
jgi:nucleotide-binding universal stress UspA family protein